MALFFHDYANPKTRMTMGGVEIGLGAAGLLTAFLGLNAAAGATVGVAVAVLAIAFILRGFLDLVSGAADNAQFHVHFHH